MDLQLKRGNQRGDDRHRRGPTGIYQHELQRGALDPQPCETQPFQDLYRINIPQEIGLRILKQHLQIHLQDPHLMRCPGKYSLSVHHLATQKSSSVMLVSVHFQPVGLESPYLR